MQEQLKKIFQDELGVKNREIKFDSKLTTDLNINSIDFANLIYICEERFKIQIDDSDLFKLETFGDVVHYMEEKLNDFKML